MIIRDPVHGDIELTEEEARVLDSRENAAAEGHQAAGHGVPRLPRLHAHPL